MDIVKAEQDIAALEAATGPVLDILDPEAGAEVAIVEKGINAAIATGTALYNAVNGHAAGPGSATWQQVSQRTKDDWTAFQAMLADRNANG